MAPKRKAPRPSLGIGTPKTPTPMHEDSMDIDTPQAGDTPRAADTPTAGKPNQPSASALLGNIWTDDQESSLFKGIIRWKPAGMHKHFRMVAISEHLRNHGINPDVESHTRIPGIWSKLRTLYNLEMIDERENYYDDDVNYKEFGLPNPDFYDMMFARRLPDDPSEAPTSPPELDLEDPTATGIGSAGTARGPPSTSGRGTKRRRGGEDGASTTGSAARARASTVEDTEEDTPVALASSPATKSTRGTRSQKRAAAKAKAESTEPEANEDSEEEEAGDNDDDEEEKNENEEKDDESEAEEDTMTKSIRGNSKAKGRASRARAVTRKGRK